MSGGIQLSLHTRGGPDSLNETVQISDHWQLSSVGRRHGWVRKLDPEEQRLLVKLTQSFDRLHLSERSEEGDGVSFTLVARGTGEGVASRKEAAALGQLLEKLTGRHNATASVRIPAKLLVTEN